MADPGTEIKLELDPLTSSPNGGEQASAPVEPIAPAQVAPTKTAKTPSCSPADGYANVTAVLQQIRLYRKRPLFALVAGTIEQKTLFEVHRWRRELKEAGKSGELDVLIDSPGGELTSCYMIARLISRYTNSWEALVPTMAASGASLICLGSSNIVMSEVASLSPIDPQVISKRQQKFFAGERQSPIEAFQAVKYLREFTLSSMDAAMRYLLDCGVAAHRALETANTLATKLVEPIVEKIDPYDLGAFDLDSTMASDYCGRIAEPADTTKKTQRTVTYKSLVERYPAHEFAIDIAEAQALKFNACAPAADLDDLFDQLRPLLENVGSYIGLISDNVVTP